MLEGPLDRLEAQARGLNSAVRVGALMRIARVRTALSRERARDVFESALREIRTFPGRDREFFLEGARQIAAAVAPELLRSIDTGRRHRHFAAESIGRIMIDHGQIDAAVDYVLRYEASPDFPYFTALALLQKLQNEEQRQAVLRKAISVGRQVPADHFIDFFSWAWTRLGEAEAQDVLREIVRTLEEQPDRGISATYDPERTVEITSVREHFLFRLLHILRKLEPALAESLIGRYEQLAAAARRFPNGIESVTEEAQKHRDATTTGEICGGYVMAGDPKDFPYLRSLLDGQRSGEFDGSIQYAIDKYRRDTDPTDLNKAPKHFWPSTCTFRQILYAAG